MRSNSRRKGDGAVAIAIVARAMTRFASPLALLALTSFTLAAAVAACSAQGNADDVITEQEAGATEPADTNLLPPSNGDGGGGALDARSDAKTDAAKDSGKETGPVDAGKPAPAKGSPCAVVDEIFTRQCGACGTQEALCIGNASGTGGTVSDYSVCTSEVDGGCIPTTVENETCGNCGTRVRTCNKYCAWTAGACTGEPANACSPTANDYTAAGCATVGTYRTRQCGTACSWSSFTSCNALDFELTVAANAGETASAIYPLRAAIADKRMTGTCGSNYFSTTTNHPYVYVELKNPTSNTLTMSAWNALAPNNGPQISTAMTVYASTTKPADEAARKTCVKTVATYCPSTIPCGYSSFAALTGTSAFTIPPNGSVLLFFQSYYAAGGASTAEGDVKLVVRTDTINP